MKKLSKKLVGFSLVASLVLSASAASAFLDVRGKVFYEDALTWALEEGIIDQGNYFRPADPVNRAEMAKMVVESLGLPLVETKGFSFLDVGYQDWFFYYVETGRSYQLFDGYTDASGGLSGFFGPSDPVTRGAVAKVLTNAYEIERTACSKMFRDVDYTAWYAPFIDAMCVAGIIQGDISGNARPADPVNRAEFVSMLYRAAGEPYVLTEEDKEIEPMTGLSPELDAEIISELGPEAGPEPEEEIVEEIIEEDEEASSPVFPDFDARTYNNFARLQAPTGSCPDGSCAVHVAQYAVTPVYDSIRLKGITFRNDDNLADFSSRFGTFFLVHEGRVVDTGSLSGSTSGDSTLTFEGFNYLLPKETRHKLNVLAEIHDISRAEDSGGFLKLYVENTGDIEAISDTNGLEVSSANINSEAGPSGPYIQTHIVRKSYPLITYSNEGISRTITGPVTNRKIYEFSISAHPNGDIEWKNLTFKINETSGLNSSNYKLYVKNSSNPVNSGASPSGGKVTITPSSPHQIPAGQTVTYILKADIEITNFAQSQTLNLELTSEDDTSLVTGTAASLSSSNFLWSDRSARSHSEATSDWTNGFEVDTLNTETVNIGYQGIGS